MMMTIPGTFRSGVMAMILFGFALSLTMPCRVKSAEDESFAALQADAQKIFRESVSPFENLSPVSTTFISPFELMNQTLLGSVPFQPGFVT